MAAYALHLEVFILLISAVNVLTSPANFRAEFSEKNPSFEDGMTPTTSALSLSEKAEYPDDLSNIPDPVSTDSKVPEVYSLNIWSSVKYRYATTLVTSRVVNRQPKAEEVVFQFFLPKNAFISGFLMETRGKVYKAYVKEKEEAKKEYKAAKERGQTAAHVAITARDSNLFSISVNLEPYSKMTFNLTYEELLTRRHGLYDHVIHLVTCNQVVQDMKVEVYIREPQKITVIKVPEPTISNELEDAVAGGYVKVSKDSSESVLVTYAPTMEQQKELLQKAKVINSLQQYEDEESASQRLRVQYDVDHISTAGEILLNDGYFVHFFAPSTNIFDTSIKPSKYVIFVLDMSGSMKFRKLEQLKDAMELILDSLNDKDYFSIIEFSVHAKAWSLNEEELDLDQMVYLATQPNIVYAKSYISHMKAVGGTNIAEAVKLALKVAKAGIRNKHFHGFTDPELINRENGSLAKKTQPMIIFLTDGMPTEGETNLSSILHSTKTQNEEIKVPIFSLAFGDDVDFKFLRKLSLQNHGFARKIYASADATLQLKSFFQEISSPLLNNVTFSYVSPKVDQSSLTKSTFHTYFAGTEVIIAGRVKDLTFSPEDLGGVVSSSASDISISVYTPRTSKELKSINNTNTGETRGKSESEIMEELEKFAIKFWPQTFGKEIHEHKLGSLERLWAFLTIHQLLDKDLASEEGETSERSSSEKFKGKEPVSPAKKKALQLALQYGFVTPLTSLVVVKPPEKDDNSTSSNGDVISDPISKNFHKMYTRISKSNEDHKQKILDTDEMSDDEIDYKPDEEEHYSEDITLSKRI